MSNNIWHYHLLNSYYTLFQKKRNINLSISPGSPGSLTLTYGLYDFVKWSLLEVVDRSVVKVESDPGSLTLTHGLQEWMISKSCVSFEEECITSSTRYPAMSNPVWRFCFDLFQKFYWWLFACVYRFKRPPWRCYTFTPRLSTDDLLLSLNLIFQSEWNFFSKTCYVNPVKLNQC